MQSWIRRGSAMLLTLLLIGCGSDPGFDEADFVAGEGTVQFINMLPDSPEVRIFHGLSQTDIRFPFSSPIEIRFEDRYDWRIAYLDTVGNEVILAEGLDQQILENTLTTFLIFGNTQTTTVQFVDTATIAASARPEGLADLWFASNSSQYPMIDVYFTQFGADLANAAPIATIGSGLSSPLFEVGAGEGQQIRLTIAGTDSLLFDSGAIEIVDRAQELFAIVDDFGPDATNHVDVIRTLAQSGSTIPDVSQRPRIRSGNYTTLPDIEVMLGDVNYGMVERDTLTTFIEQRAGAADLVVSSDGNSLEQSEQQLFNGFFQSVLTFDNPDDSDSVRSLSVFDSLRPVADRVELKFVNGSDQTVDFYILQPEQTTESVPPAFNDVGFAGTTTLELRANTLELVATTADGQTRVAAISTTLAEGGNYTLILDNSGGLTLNNK